MAGCPGTTAGPGSATGWRPGTCGSAPASTTKRPPQSTRDDPAPGCTSECATATTGGAYPHVWDDDLADEGADPDRLVAVTDEIGAASLPESEGFHTVR